MALLFLDFFLLPLKGFPLFYCRHPSFAIQLGGVWGSSRGAAVWSFCSCTHREKNQPASPSCPIPAHVCFSVCSLPAQHSVTAVRKCFGWLYESGGKLTGQITL